MSPPSHQINSDVWPTHVARKRNSCTFAARFGKVILAALISAGGFLASAPSTATEKLDNATCLECHAEKKAKIEVKNDKDEARVLNHVNPDKFGKGVHSTMQCVDCHSGIKDAKADHAKTAEAKVPDCVQCHENLWEKAKKDGLAQMKSRLGVVVDNIEAYKKSFHARPNKEDPTKVYATCNECHNVHSFDIAPKGTTRRAESKADIPNTCGKCHEDQLDEYKESVHGKAILEKDNVKAAVCSDCHTTHAVANTSAAATKLSITDRCGSCHDDKLASYKKTYHGQAVTLGDARTGKCFDCHGSHGILASKEADSKVNPENVLKTCSQCHNPKKGLPQAPAGFSTFKPHATTKDFDKYPETYIASKFMIGLLLGTFAFFWTHTLLWFYREWKERKEGKLRKHVNVAAMPEEFQGKHIQRFRPMWRLAHLTFALTLMTLTTTGMPLFFPDAVWAPIIMKALGGVKTAGIIHRTAATIFATVFFLHLVAVIVKIARNWSTFKFFGPNSLIPNLKDLADVIAMFKWFFGKGPRPQFERWTYFEKFDYWAPFWGVNIIGVSGLMMWFPHITAQYLPGWVFNVAMIFHSEEAVLAVVFLFTVHFFNCHFRPDKFPLDTVMFTGAFTVEEFRHEHPAEYDRLVQTGELQKYLVDAPSRPMKIGSRILGFTLITIGLTLLTMVAVGFLGI